MESDRETTAFRAVYAALMDRAPQSPSFDEIPTELIGPEPVRPIRPREPKRSPRWAVGLAAAVAVLLLVGGVAWLVRSLSSEGAPTITDPPVPTSTVPAPTTTVLEPTTTTVVNDPTTTTLGEEPPPTVAPGALGQAWVLLPSLSEGKETFIHDVTFASPGLIAVGGENLRDGGVRAALWTSADGVTWDQVAESESVLAGANLRGVAPFGSGAVAVAWDGAVLLSPDGITWSRVVDPGVPVNNNGSITDLVAGGPGLLAVGQECLDECRAAVWASPDGHSSTLGWQDEPGLHSVMAEVIAEGPGFIGVGRQCSETNCFPAVWTSADGITWTQVPDDPEVFALPGAM